MTYILADFNKFVFKANNYRTVCLKPQKWCANIELGTESEACLIIKL